VIAAGLDIGGHTASVWAALLGRVSEWYGEEGRGTDEDDGRR